jgi:hypothetical protein
MEKLLGEVPCLNGGFFEVHQLEEHNPDIDIPDKAFEKLFDFFDQYSWHLDERPLRADNEINPDVVGYIFEKYINQKQMGAYYTKEDITEYISKNTIIPFLFDAAQKKCAIAFQPDSALWRLLRSNPDRYIYPAVRHGVIRDDGSIVSESELPDFVQTGMRDPRARMDDKRFNLGQAPAGDPIRLVTETWREYMYRRRRCLEVREKLQKGEVHQVNDLITLNLDIWQFARDVIVNAEGRSFFGRSGTPSKRSPSWTRPVARGRSSSPLCASWRRSIATALSGWSGSSRTWPISPTTPSSIATSRRCSTNSPGIPKSQEGKLGFTDNLIKRIEKDAEMVEKAFRQFRTQQTTHGGKVTRKDKQELRTRLAKLDAELDRYLAGEYGVNVEKEKAFDAWKASHEPFHWFVEFYGIMSGGGFDVIIGNPPYVNTRKISYDLASMKYHSLGAGDLFTLIVSGTLPQKPATTSTTIMHQSTGARCLTLCPCIALTGAHPAGRHTSKTCASGQRRKPHSRSVC